MDDPTNGHRSQAQAIAHAHSQASRNQNHQADQAPHVALYRTTTQATTATTSSASSSRTVRPSSVRTARDMRTPTTSIFDGSDGFSYHQGYPSYPFAPIVPGRSSSLHVRDAFMSQGSSTAGGSADVPPSVQVTMATPTKSRKGRRKSPVHMEDEQSSPPSPSRRNSAQDVNEGDPRGRARSRDEMEYDSEEENAKLAEEEAKKARAREKGRERQRRKRERDRKTKDEARAAGNHPPANSSLTTATHLPIPIRTSSAGRTATAASMAAQAAPLALAGSVPSSASSSYASLPHNQSYFNLSPNLSLQSISGASSPGSLFSPNLENILGFTPETAFASVQDPQVGLDMDKLANKSKSRQQGGPLPPDAHVPFSDHSAASSLSEPSSAKRRRSEPEPEEFRDKMKEGSMGVDETLWSPVSERPKHPRTTSGGMSMPPNLRHDSDDYGVRTNGAGRNGAGRVGASTTQPSDGATFFAETLIYGMTSSNLLSALEMQLGVGKTELEDMKGALAGVFDAYRMERGMRSVSLGSSHAGSEIGSSASNPPLSIATTDSNSGSPARLRTDLSNTFFTPASTRTSRSIQQPSTLPSYNGQQPNDGQNMFAESPSAPQTLGFHSRTRSLSSTSMLARGLVLNSGAMPVNEINAEGRGSGDAGDPRLIQQWTDSLSTGQIDGSYGSEGTGSSVSVNTPSTGQVFPHSESMDSMSDTPNHTLSHSRSANQLNMAQSGRFGSQGPQGPHGQVRGSGYVMSMQGMELDNAGVGPPGSAGSAGITNDPWAKDDHPGMLGHMEIRPQSQGGQGTNGMEGHVRTDSNSSSLSGNGQFFPTQPSQYTANGIQHIQHPSHARQYSVDGSDDGLYGLNSAAGMYYAQAQAGQDPHGSHGSHGHQQGQSHGQTQGQVGMNGGVYGYGYYQPGQQAPGHHRHPSIDQGGMSQ